MIAVQCLQHNQPETDPTCLSRAAKGKSTGLYDRWAARAKTRIGAAGEAEDPRSNSRAREVQDRCAVAP